MQRRLDEGIAEYREALRLRPGYANAQSNLGAALAEALLARDWLRRRPNDRALLITPAGATALRRELGVELD